jgi:sugar O-acyltransferase (sialic acid O-acetyltransferase NeuD family)
MQQTNLILIGGGGHCKACIDVIEHTGEYNIIGILDQEQFVDTTVLNHKIIGTDADISKYVQLGYHFLITVGQIKTAAIRMSIFLSLEQHGAELATIISPKAHVSNYATVGKGTIVMHNAVLNAASVIGENCILNTGCNIEHDAVIGSHCHISTQAVINGNCIIGNEVFVGSNATVSNGIVLKDRIVIGAGAVVNKDLSGEGMYVGNPIRKIDR